MELFLSDGLCYRFIRKRKFGIGALWACVEPGCKFLALTEEDYEIIRSIGYHSYINFPTKLERVIIMMQDLQRTMEASSRERRKRSESSTDKKIS
ncbi:hypothetical protein GWI33_014042 [Rhynchophorus ferrugineus]|uniref:Uncharacterized protein n=1 Tax=Rhynchophorus ferrugineus TaxID=354439 RepID=A0A834I6Y3_RHYFE|nr:hypothetical protein GWI33_014042 [Rhynchophorus ferrugineus]